MLLFFKHNRTFDVWSLNAFPMRWAVEGVLINPTLNAAQMDAEVNLLRIKFNLFNLARHKQPYAE